MHHPRLTHRLRAHNVLCVDYLTKNSLNAVYTYLLQVLRPLGGFATEEATALYPAITAGDMMQEELRAISLAS